MTVRKQLAEYLEEHRGEVFENAFGDGIDKNDIDIIIDALKEEPRAKGKWIEIPNISVTCPLCNKEYILYDNCIEDFNFCPNCGAELGEE